MRISDKSLNLNTIMIGCIIEISSQSTDKRASKKVQQRNAEHQLMKQNSSVISHQLKNSTDILRGKGFASTE